MKLEIWSLTDAKKLPAAGAHAPAGSCERIVIYWSVDCTGSLLLHRYQSIGISSLYIHIAISIYCIAYVGMS